MQGSGLDPRPAMTTTGTGKRQTRREEFFARLPEETFCPEEVTLRKALFDVLVEKGGSARLSEVALDDRIRQAKSVLFPKCGSVSIGTWIHRRLHEDMVVQPDPESPENHLLSFAGDAETQRSASARRRQPRQKSKVAEQWQQQDKKGHRATDRRLHVEDARRSARSARAERRQNCADRRDTIVEEVWQEDYDWHEDYDTHGATKVDHREHRVKWQSDYDRQNVDESHSAPRRQSSKVTKIVTKKEEPEMVLNLPRTEVQRWPSPGWRPWVYLASGLGFSSQQYDRVLPRLVAAIEAAGAQVYEPFTDNPEVNKPAKEQTPGWAYRIGQADIDAVRRCDGLFCWANMNPPDEGAMVELGVAIGLRKKVFLYRDDFRTCAAVEDYPLNLMLFSGLPEKGWQNYYYTSLEDIVDPQKAFRRWCDGDTTV